MPGQATVLSLVGARPAVAALLGAAATALAVRSGHRRSTVARTRPPGAAGLPGRDIGRWVAGAGVLALMPVAGPVPVLALAPVAVAAAWVRRSSARRRQVADDAAAWCAALGRCAAALRAGSPLGMALLTAAGPEAASGDRRSGRLGDARAPGRLGDAPAGRSPASAGAVLAAAAGVLAAGGDPVALLRVSGGEGGAARQLAAALRLSELTGAAPAALAGALAASAAADQEAAREARLALAGAEATARLLAALPLAGIPLAAAFGASALQFLLHGSAGPVVLALAAVFESAGLVWTERLAAGALR